MKLLIDMNLSPRWVDVLIAADIPAIHWSSVGPHDAPDVEIMDYARQHGYVVLTHDLDFGAILAATQGRTPSVVQIRAPDPSPEAIGPSVISALRHVRAELETGALVTFEPARVRLTLLPLQSF